MKMSIKPVLSGFIPLILCVLIVSGCSEVSGITIAFDNTTSESLFVSIAGPGEGTGPIGVIAPAPNMIVRKLHVDQNDLPGQYTWSAGKYNGKFTINKKTTGPVCIRIPGGLSQMPDLVAYSRNISKSKHVYSSSAPSNVDSRRYAPRPGSEHTTPVASRRLPKRPGEDAEFYMAERSPEPVYVPSNVATYSLPSVIYSEGGSTSVGGFGSVYNSTSYGYGSGISGGFYYGGNNGYIGGVFYPQPYIYNPVNHPNGVIYPGVIGGVYPRYPHRHYNHNRPHRPTTPRRVITPTTSLNGPTIQISNPMTR